MLPAAVNLNATAELDDATCVRIRLHRPDGAALLVVGDVDDGSCIPTVVGCMWPDSHNYNPAATRGDQRLCYDGLTSPSPPPLIAAAVAAAAAAVAAVAAIAAAAVAAELAGAAAAAAVAARSTGAAVAAHAVRALVGVPGRPPVG